MGAFILILVIVGIGVTVAAVNSGGSGANSIWQAAAQRLGLRYEHTDTLKSPTISGARRGLSVHIDTFSKSGDDHRTYTRYRVNFKKSLGLGLRLVKQGPFAYVSRKLGTQDIVTGDQDFDDTVIVKGRNPKLVKEFLNATRRLRAVRFLTLYPGAAIDDSGIECEERNVVRSPDRIVQVIQRMTALAEQLTADDDGAPDYLAAMTHPDETEADPHIIGLPYHPEPGPISLEDLLVAESEPAEVTEPPQSSFDAPEAIDEEILSVAEPPDLDELFPEEPEAAEPSSSDEVGPSASTVAETLFAQTQTTSRAAEIFDSRFKGRSVAWSGTLTNVRSYRFDLVFGDVPGTRAEVEVAGAADSAAGGRAVKAVVQCPVEAEDKLRTLVDHRVVFQGVLSRCDVFMKTLFLTDGDVSEVDA